MHLTSHRNKYPFTLSVPSFVYPDTYASNVRQLAHVADEVELLFFESAPQSLPDDDESRQLRQLINDTGIGYNIHLPVDIQLDHEDLLMRKNSIDRLAAIVDRYKDLKASTLTLHLPMENSACQPPSALKHWQRRIEQSLEHLLSKPGMPAPGMFSIETLAYPPSWLLPIVENLDLGVCIDVGHVFRYGYDLTSVFQMFSSRTTIMHVHGVVQGRDHVSLNRLSPPLLQTVGRLLERFTGVVSLEVFSLKGLADSLACLDRLIPNTDSDCHDR